MKTPYTKLSAILDMADKQASTAAYNLNTLDMRIAVPSSIQSQIDREASGIKAFIGEILKAKEIVKGLINSPESGALVYLWLIIENDDDWESELFVWPFKQLPNNGDRLDAFLIKGLCPLVSSFFLEVDYYVLQYSFFEVDSHGVYHQCLKLSPPNKEPLPS